MTATTPLLPADPGLAHRHDLAEIADRFGTPLFVYEADVLRATFDRLRDALHPRLEIFYSLKANPSLAVVSTLHAQGARAEVCSMVELCTALRAGVAPDDIIFLGPGKSAAEIVACLDAGIHALIVESFQELELVDHLAGERGVRPRVALRVNPSFSVKGSGLTMGGKPRQFGIDDVLLLDGPRLAPRYPNLDLVGLHVYMGTRILDAAVVVQNTVQICALAERIVDHQKLPLELLDIGGGLGVPYFDGEQRVDVDALAAGVNPIVEQFAQRHPSTRLVMELGRYLVGEAGTYLTRVRYTKTSREERFAVADGGSNHHMPAVGIGSFVRRNFPVDVVGRDSFAEREPWTVTGPLCTPNDVVARKANLPPLRPGDVIGVARSGAYGPTASPGLFLSHGFPAEVLVVDGEAHLVRRADTADDLLERQLPLPVRSVAAAVS